MPCQGIRSLPNKRPATVKGEVMTLRFMRTLRKMRRSVDSWL